MTSGFGLGEQHGRREGSQILQYPEQRGIEECRVLVTLPMEADQLSEIGAVHPRVAIDSAADEYIVSLGLLPSELPGLRGRVNLENLSKREAEARLTPLLEKAEVIYTAFVLPDLIKRSPKLRWVHLSSHGADHLKGDILQSGVIVTTGQGGHTTAVAEHIMALVLMLAKNAPCFTEQKREHRWERSYPVIELARSTIGLVGFGSIGKRVARYTQAFGMRVLAYDPFQTSEQVDQLGVVLVEELDYLLAESDFVALTLPLTEETRGMIGEQALKKMKPSAYLINACRGRLVNEPALVWALGEKRLAGAGLDVFELMPLPGESPLWDMDNVIITPQSAAASPYLRENTNRVFIENLRCYLAGEQLRNIYHRSRGF